MKRANGGKIKHKSSGGTINNSEMKGTMIPEVTIYGKKPNVPNMIKVRPLEYLRNTYGDYSNDPNIRTEIRFAQQGKSFMPVEYSNSIKKHAYGSPIKASWNSGDYAGAAVDTGSGVLSGLGMGASLGSVLGPAGTAIGAVAGGLFGLAKGLFGGSAKAKARAAAKEANRQQTLRNMEDKTLADTTNQGFDDNGAVKFYLKGGRIGIKGLSSGNGMIPASHDTTLAVGPSHEQGGIPYGSEDEVEGGETIQMKPDGDNVFSARLAVPGSKVSFADASMPYILNKAKLEKSFARNEKTIEKERESITKRGTSVLTIGSAKRRTQILAAKNEQTLSEIEGSNAALDNLFKMQEKVNGNIDTSQPVESSEQTQQEPIQAGNGRRIFAGGGFKSRSFDQYTSEYMKKFTTPQLGDGSNLNLSKFKVDRFALPGTTPTTPIEGKGGGFGDNQLLFQAGADFLDTASQMINDKAMSDMPVPTRALAVAPRFNSHVDNSDDLVNIKNSAASTRKFLRANVRNPQVLRNMMISTNISENSATSQSLKTKLEAETEIENRNVAMLYENTARNNRASYENASDRYNASMASINRKSQISANFADKIGGIGVAKAQMDSNDIAFSSILSQYPEGVRKLIAKQLSMGRSYKNAIKIALGQ